MSRYERRFGTDWTDVDGEDALERAYALGVAAALGEHHPAELDRLREAMHSGYGRGVIELAYDEGKTAAATAEADTESAPTSVWEEVLDDPTAETANESLPAPVLERLSVVERPNRDLREAEALPSFLERD